MARRKKLDRPKSLELSIPESLKTSLEQELFDHDKGKIPFGAFSKLGIELFQNWLRLRGYKF